MHLATYHRRRKTVGVGGGTRHLWMHKFKTIPNPSNPPPPPVNFAAELIYIETQLTWPKLVGEENIIYTILLFMKFRCWILCSIVLISMALEGGALSPLQADWGSTCPWCPPASATYAYGYSTPYFRSTFQYNDQQVPSPLKVHDHNNISNTESGNLLWYNAWPADDTW